MPETASDFLCHYERPAREPLRCWAARLVGVVGEPPAETFADAARQHEAFSNAALIFAYLGEPDRAAEILVHQLALVDEAIRRRRDPLFLSMVIDPWVNLGRLCSRRGDADAARRHFADVFALRSGADCRVGPCEIPADDWARTRVADHRLDELTAAIYVIESLKALFVAERFDEAARFLDTVGWARATPLRSLLVEADLIALAGVGRHDEVLAAVPPEAAAYDQAVFALHGVESRLAIGAESGHRQAVGLAVLLLHDGMRARPEALFRFAARCGRVLDRPAQRTVAAAVHERGLRIAQQLGDEPGEWGFLAALRGSAGTPTERRAWDSACRTLTTRSHYRSVRAAECLPPVPPGDLDPVYDRLLDGLRGRTSF